MNNKSISNMALENLKSMQDMSVTSSLLGKILVLTEFHKSYLSNLRF